MSIATTKPVTTEEFLRREAEAPEGVSLELIAGEIVERPTTTRRPRHTQALTRIGHQLLSWLESRSELAGSVNTGDVRCRLQRDPDVLVGIDVAVWLGSEFVEPPINPPLYDAPPVLAIEVLSPSDTQDKLSLYLSCGVQQVWIVDPDLETVTIYRRDGDPQILSSRQTLSADPELPGFRVPVVQLFHSRQNAT